MDLCERGSVAKRAADTRRTGTDTCMHSLTRSGNSMAMALVTAEALLNLATTTVRTRDMANRSPDPAEC